MIEKEFRALLPVWLAVAVALVGAHLTGRNWEWLSVAAYLLGAPAIGALAFGHEYSHRTVSLMLTLPVRRGRIWLVKIASASILVAAVTGIGIYADVLRRGDQPVSLALFSITTLAAIGLAPWYSLLSRNALAGTVFTVSTAGILMLVGAWIGVRYYGYTSEVDNFQTLFMWWTMMPLCAIGLVTGRRAFIRLQAFEGRGKEFGIEVNRPADAAPTMTRRNPLLLLIRKELRLQQLPCTLGLIYTLLYLGLVGLNRKAWDTDSVAMALTSFSGIVTAIVIGAVSVAEERQLGTLESQWLQPAAASGQWLVKTATAFVLAALLTGALPLALTTILPPQHARIFGRTGIVQPQWFALCTFVIAVTIYVSALSRSSLQALLASIASLVAVAIFFTSVVLTLANEAFMATHTATPIHGRTMFLRRYTFVSATEAKVYFAVFAAGLILLILRFAAVNARTSEKDPRRIALQVTCAAAVGVAGFALAGALGIR